MSAATMPTKNAASSSIPSMKRSMRSRLTTRSGFDWSSAMMRSAIPWSDICAAGGGDFRRRSGGMPIGGSTGAALLPPPSSARRAERARREIRRSVRRLVLGERLLELLHDGIRIAAGLADVVGPLLLQWLGRLLPFVELRVGDRVDVMPGLGFDLGQTRVLEIRPRIGEFPRPLGGAVVVDDLLLRRRHGRIGARAHQPLERDGVERRVHVIFRDLVEDRKSTRLNSSHLGISYAVFCLKKKNNKQ